MVTLVTRMLQQSVKICEVILLCLSLWYLRWVPLATSDAEAKLTPKAYGDLAKAEGPGEHALSGSFSGRSALYGFVVFELRCAYAFGAGWISHCIG